MANRVLAGALAFTWLFFAEYLPPFERVHIPYDLDGFHYPLLDYAFQELRDGRFPEWDASVYCGISYAGNPQTALFYPGTWLLFAANWTRSNLSYSSLEVFVLLHVWLAFAFTWLWLRGKGIGVLPAILGAAVFAFAGPTVVQLQHLGWMIAIAWMPLACWGIDQSVQSGSWRPLWKVTAASAMSFLGGYPPAWFAFAASLPGYALLSGSGGWKHALRTMGALGVSVPLVMVQLLPAMEASALVQPEFRYGGGIWDADFFRALFVPRFHDYSLYAQFDGGAEYVYLGAPALLGLAWFAIRRGVAGALPLIGLLAAALLWMINPFGLVGVMLIRADRLAALCRDYYFLSPVVLAVAGLCALSIDDLLRWVAQRKRQVQSSTVAALGVALLAWCALQLQAWGTRGGAALRTGWASALDALAMLLLLGLALVVWQRSTGPLRVIAAVVLLFAVGVEYKTFGTLSYLNAAKGGSYAIDEEAKTQGFASDERAVLQSQRQYRVALDLTAPFPGSLRHLRLSTPQGFDPMLPDQYRSLVQSLTPFRSNREFEIAPANVDALRLLGVRYYVTTDGGPGKAAVSADVRFQERTTGEQWVRTFELLDAQAAYRWESARPDDSSSVRLISWTPGERLLATHTTTARRLVFIEQFFPGWQAWIDGKPAPLHRWRDAFQAVDVPAGDHEVRFRFRSRSLRTGAVVSLLTLAASLLLRWGSRVRKPPFKRLLTV